MTTAGKGAMTPTVDDVARIAREGERIVTGLPVAIWILDRLSGEHRPLVPGLFERALDRVHLQEIVR